MHGVGTELARRVFTAAGFAEPLSVAEQAEPDADFPTVAFPNPEEPGAMDLALALAARSNADLVIANDPDADRCAVAVPVPGGRWQLLSGDQVGVLLADHLMSQGIRGTYATTVVSSSMLRALCADRGVGYAETLTGFKWISRAAPDLVFGYEEALGYAVAPGIVRDKDGISAALLVAALAASGTSLTQRLEELYDRYGRHATAQLAVRVDDAAQIAAMMTRLRAAPPARLLGAPVAVEDLLPHTDALRFGWSGGRVVVRPSGTEPKLKAYLEVVTATAAQAADQLAALRAEVAQALGVPAARDDRC
jgi:phosphomannomutase